MEQYLKLFTNHSAYSQAESSLDRPNVSHCISENHVHYNPTDRELYAITAATYWYASASNISHLDVELDKPIEETPVTNPRLEVRPAGQPSAEPIIFQAQVEYGNDYVMASKEGEDIVFGNYTAVLKFENNGQTIKTPPATFTYQYEPGLS
jgi:hypothetical protein